MELTRDWGAKLAGATLRLAGVMHCVEHGPKGNIGESAILAAIEIAKYHIPHAHAVLNLMQAQENPVNGDARYVLRWIKHHSKLEFTKRAAHQHGRRRFRRVDDMDPALAELTQRGTSD